ncbi:MAG TPA: DNA repair protein RecN [Clostridiales bacterium]|nr:DNA repair protein RecN [Clostridiales bacterium]
MLKSLSIENIAIIESAQIDFSEGLNVLTGETGAGKSIIIDSINCIIGEKTSRELIRTGANSARVASYFENLSDDVIAYLNDLNIPVDNDKSLSVSRTIYLDGRNNCRVNGVSVNVSMLKTIGHRLVNIHGQHDSQDLLNPDMHIKYIDALCDCNEVFDEYHSAFLSLRELHSRIKKLKSNEANRLDRIDMLKFQITEIENAKIAIGEYDKLRTTRDIAQNSQNLIESLNSILYMLDGSEQNDGVKQMTKTCADILDKTAAIVPAFKLNADALNNCYYEVEAVIDSVNEHLSTITFSEKELDAINDRIETLEHLMRKYGGSEEAVLSYYDGICQEKNDIDNSDEMLEILQKQFETDSKTVREKALNISEIRKKTANIFANRIINELKSLNMPSVTFHADFEKTPLSYDGIDAVSFYISANIGEAPKPLYKIASGGELARIMLAIKRVLADKDEIPTLIFDEVDTGVSGSAAEKIAIKMKDISRNKQVLCVTHLTQIAAFADSHLLIEKKVTGGKTTTDVTTLDFDARVRELARISGGVNISDAQLNSAKDYLEYAAKLQNGEKL